MYSIHVTLSGDMVITIYEHTCSCESKPYIIIIMASPITNHWNKPDQACSNDL